MSYRIEFFNEAVEAGVMEWPGGILASFTRIAERITEHGPNLGMPYTRAMGDGLFEIRAKGQEGIGRAPCSAQSSASASSSCMASSRRPSKPRSVHWTPHAAA